MMRQRISSRVFWGVFLGRDTCKRVSKARVVKKEEEKPQN